MDICHYWFKFKLRKLDFRLNLSQIVPFRATKRTGRIRSGRFGDFVLRDGDEDDELITIGSACEPPGFGAIEEEKSHVAWPVVLEGESNKNARSS